MSTPKSLRAAAPPRLQKSLKINASHDASGVTRNSSSASSSNGSGRKQIAPPPEKKVPIVSKAAGFHQVQEDLVKTRELLSLTEKSKANLMQDLARAKRNVEDLTTKLMEKSKSHVETVQPNKMEDNSESCNSPDSHDTFVNSQGNGSQKIEIDSMRDRYEAALLEIEANKQTIDALKHELFVCVEAKDEAVRLAGEAMTAAESTSRRFSELSSTLSQRNIKPLPSTINSSEIQLNEFTDELYVSFNEGFLECDELYSIRNSSRNCDEGTVSESSQIMETKKNEFAEKTADNQVHMELEEAQEKLLSFALMESVLVSSLEILKAELERSKEEMKSRETSASRQVEDLNSILERLTESNQKEVLMLKQREASSLLAMEDLRVDLSNHKSEMASIVERERALIANADALSKELEARKHELIEHQKECNKEVIVLRMEVERTQEELMKLKEREHLDSTRISSLVCDLASKDTEAVELQRRLSEMSGKLESISALSRSDEVKLVELREQEVIATAKIMALSTEIFEVKKSLEEAVRNSQVSREEMVREKEIAHRRVSSLEGCLKVKQSEVVELRERLSDMDTKLMALSISLSTLATTNKDEGDDAKRASVADNVVDEKTTSSVKLAMEEAQLARKEAELVKALLEESVKGLEAARLDAQQAREEAQRSRDELASMKKIESTMVDMGVSGEESRDVRLAGIELGSMRRTGELKKQSGDRVGEEEEEEEEKEKSSGTNEESKCVQRDANNNSHDRMDKLKMKLEACERELEAAIAEAGRLSLENEKLLMDLSVADSEREANKRGMVEAHRSLVEMEKAKSVLEADIQRLLDESKQRRASPEVKDIPINSSVSERLAFECREEKPQPDSPPQQQLQQQQQQQGEGEAEGEGEEGEEGEGEVSVANMGMATPLHVHPKEDMVDSDEPPPPHQSTTTARGKKKKKTPLLHRLHSYLDKKKNSHV